MQFDLKFSQYNERSILIEWPAIIDENILNSILKFKEILIEKYIKQNIEVINTYSSILIIYNLTIDNVNSRFLELKSLSEDINITDAAKFSTWEIPVCYDDEFGFDLSQLSKEKGLSKSEIIKRHTAPKYTVFFMGFLPGFLYLGGLDSKLHFDRKSKPNLNIKKGAVGIGGQQTGIYPQDSPGGWHIIGKTPVTFFNPNMNPPCEFKSGDKVKFLAIDKTEFIDLERKISNEDFELKPLRK